MARRFHSAPSNRWLRISAWTVCLAAGLLLALVLGARIWINSYLRSTEFRSRLSERTAEHLRARVEIGPVSFDGTQFFCDSLHAKGGVEAKFSEVTIENIRGEFRLPAMWRLLLGERRFRVDSVDVQRLEANFFEDRLSLNLPPLNREERMTEVGRVGVRELKLGWNGGSISGLGVTATKADGGWRITGQGGEARQAGLPLMEIVSVRVLHKEPSLFIHEARLREGGGEVVVTGEVTEEEKADLQFKLAGVSVTPLLPEDWRARLRGRIAGDVRAVMPLKPGPAAAPIFTGNARLQEGVLEALPVLNRIAEFTKTDRFRQIALNQARGDFRMDGSGLKVTNFVLESERLISVKGQFTVIDGQIDGTFQVGITPGPLQWLPGSQEKVFNTMRDGYAWTNLRISGPVKTPREDLSSRLAAAAQAAVVEKVESTATQAVGGAVETVKKGATGVLDLLLGN
ncbi:MAG: hypothetical protein ABMA01_01550 [Chthoniobacteraceae bacterium]